MSGFATGARSASAPTACEDRKQRQPVPAGRLSALSERVALNKKTGTQGCRESGKTCRTCPRHLAACAERTRQQNARRWHKAAATATRLNGMPRLAQGTRAPCSRSEPEARDGSDMRVMPRAGRSHPTAAAPHPGLLQVASAPRWVVCSLAVARDARPLGMPVNRRCLALAGRIGVPTATECREQCDRHGMALLCRPWSHATD